MRQGEPSKPWLMARRLRLSVELRALEEALDVRPQLCKEIIHCTIERITEAGHANRVCH